MSWYDFFTPGRTAEEDQANRDRQAAILNQQIADGKFKAYQVAQINAALGASQSFAEDERAAASSGFVEGLGDGLGNIKAAVTGWGPFKVIPIWVWVAAIIGLFFYLGGFARLKGVLKKP